ATAARAVTIHGTAREAGDGDVAAAGEDTAAVAGGRVAVHEAVFLDDHIVAGAVDAAAGADRGVVRDDRPAENGDGAADDASAAQRAAGHVAADRAAGDEAPVAEPGVDAAAVAASRVVVDLAIAADGDIAAGSRAVAREDAAAVAAGRVVVYL